MARIAWEYEPITGRWLGKVGARIAFTVKPGSDNQSWDIVFSWTGVTFDGFPNITSTRDACERKLIIFAEQTGLTLPDDIAEEEEPSLAQSLVKGFMGEMHWLKDSDTDEKRAEYLAVQALGIVTELVESRKKRLDASSWADDPQVNSAIVELEDLLDTLNDAQEELGVEVERGEG